MKRKGVWLPQGGDALKVDNEFKEYGGKKTSNF